MEIKENASIVIAGSWNVGILNPTWFAREFPKLKLESGKDVDIEVEITTGSLRFLVQKIKINPNPHKLIFFSDVDENENYELMSEIAAETVNKLQHTPIIAVGHNISFFTDNTFGLFEDHELNECEKFYKDTASAIALNSQEIKHPLAYENYILNLTYNINRERNYIKFNYNYTTNNKEKIIEYLKDFRENIENSKEIYSKLVKENAT